MHVRKYPVKACTVKLFLQCSVNYINSYTDIIEVSSVWLATY